jgi:hypothetical protein
MQGQEVEYLGRLVSKEGFRAFIYGRDNLQKCVNSWDEFENQLATGLWFASVDEIPTEEDEPEEGGVLKNLINPKPKGKRK